MKKTQTEMTNDYKKKALHRINLNYANTDAEKIKSFCKKIDMPVQAFIKEAIDEKMARMSDD